MPFNITWESPQQILVRFSGIVTFAETAYAKEAFYNDSRSDDVELALWDFSAIEDFAVSERDVQEMAFTDNIASHYMKPMKAAFIITDPELRRLGDSYVELMRKLGSRWQNRIFATVEDARFWLSELPHSEPAGFV